MPFSKLLCNEKIKQTLSNLLITKKFSHSLLFHGKEGIGKRLFAIEFVKALFGDSHLHKINSGNHPDLIMLSPESLNGQYNLETIKRVIDGVKMPPFEAPSKVFIIDDADKMTPIVSNALLKTLEEPEKNNLIILISSNPNALLATIISRVQKFSFLPIPLDEIAEYLVNEKEISFEKAQRIASFSEGSLAKAIDLVDSDEVPIFSLLEIIKNGDKLSLISLLDKWEKEGDLEIDKIDQIIEKVLYYVKDCFYLENKTPLQELIYGGNPDLYQDRKYSFSTSFEKLVQASLNTKEALLCNVKPRAVLEQFLMLLIS